VLFNLYRQPDRRARIRDLTPQLLLSQPSVSRLIERLASRHEVHAFTLRHLPQPTTYQLTGATVHDLGRPQGHRAQWKALSAALGAHAPFAVVHGYWADPAGVLAAIAGRRFGIPAIVTCDSGEFVSLPAIDYGLQRTRRGRAMRDSGNRPQQRRHDGLGQDRTRGA